MKWLFAETQLVLADQSDEVLKRAEDFYKKESSYFRLVLRHNEDIVDNAHRSFSERVSHIAQNRVFCRIHQVSRKLSACTDLPEAIIDYEEIVNWFVVGSDEAKSNVETYLQTLYDIITNDDFSFSETNIVEALISAEDLPPTNLSRVDKADEDDLKEAEEVTHEIFLKIDIKMIMEYIKVDEAVAEKMWNKVLSYSSGSKLVFTLFDFPA